MTQQNEFTQEQMFEHIQHLLGPCALCDEIKATIAENDALKAEVERLTYLHDLDHKLADQWREKKEKAEAELAERNGA